jgi:predicted acetyltransferase
MLYWLYRIRSIDSGAQTDVRRFLVEIIKLTTPEQLKRSSQLSSMVFFYPMDEKQDFIPEPGREVWAMAEGDNILSQIAVYEYRMMYHGRYLPMFGIGDVGTRMEQRRKGYIRELFHAIFAEMRGRGYALSYLYPFSNRYYSQYGYSLGVMSNIVKIPIAQLGGYSCGYDVRMYEQGDSAEPYKAAYELFAPGYTGMAKMRDWKKLEDYLPAKNKRFMYLFSKNGEPRGYLGFVAEGRGNEERVMDVTDMAWADIETLHNILGFAGGSGAHFGFFKAALPDTLPIAAMVPEAHTLEVKLTQAGQVRVIDMRQALEGYPWPEWSGSVTIKVEDGHFAENTGAFRVTFGPDGASVEKTDSLCDLEADIRVMNLLLFGTVGFNDLAYSPYGGYTVHANRELLSKVFVKRPTFITEHF